MFDKKVYVETFSSLHASEDILLEVMNMKRKRKSGVSAARTIALAAVLMVVCSLAALAAVGFIRYEDPMAMIRAFFGENVGSGSRIVEYNDDGTLRTDLPAWERIPVDETLSDTLIAPYIFAANESTSFGDYNLNVEAALFDSATGAGIVYYTVENAAGVSGYEVLPNGELWWPVEAEIFTQIREPYNAYIDAAMSTDTKLYVCAYFIAGSNAESICIDIGSGENRSRLNSVELKLHDGGVADIELAGGAIRLSPISIQIDKNALGLALGNDIDYIVLNYSNGDQYVLVDESAFISNRSYAVEDQGVSTYTYNRIVDTNSIASVTIEGATYL